MVALRLCKSGYGRPDQILRMPTDVVLTALEYERFLKDYEAEFIELNREGKK